MHLCVLQREAMERLLSVYCGPRIPLVPVWVWGRGSIKV